MTVKRILVTTDLSAAAAQSYPIALELADRFGARIDVLYVDDIATRDDGRVAGLSDYLSKVDHVRQHRLAALRRRFADGGHPVGVTVIEGHPAHKVIARHIAQHDVDLVVMARHVSPGPFRKLLGSTTRRVLRTVDVPVVVVPVADDGIAPADGEPTLSHVLAPTDLSASSDLAILAIVDLAATLRARVTVSHVLEWPTLPAIPPDQGFLDMPADTQRAMQSHYEMRLQNHIAALVGHPVDAVVARGSDVAATLIAAARRVGADLIALPSTGKGRLARTFLGSVSEAVIKRSPVPVLVFPPPYVERFGETHRGELSPPEEQAIDPLP